MSKCADCNDLVGEEWSANNGLCSTCARDEVSKADTNQASEDEPRETIERLLMFNCPNGCDGSGTYPEMSSDGEWDQGQCQWCFEYGMPAREAIKSLIRTEKLKLLAEVRERVIGEDKKPTGNMTGLITIDKARNELRAEMRNKLTKLEAEL